MADLSGTVVGNRYTIERELGRGGMATVWLATDPQHSRKVAIKTLHPELAGAIGTDRFLREIRLTAQLQHPRIVPILDSGVLAEVHAALGDIGAAMRALGRYRFPRDKHFQLHLRCSPTFAPMERDSTFRALLAIPRPAPGQHC